MRTSIVDYGMGNLASVANAVYAAGGDPVFVDTPEAVLAADRLILPGVGAAGAALANLRRRGIDAALTRSVREKGRPTLGICLGMQVIARHLFEFGEHEGLGWIAGEVRSLAGQSAAESRVPHMGWNTVVPLEPSKPFFDRIRGPLDFYFCHSYALFESREDHIAARTVHGLPLVAAVRDATVFATQFHPEKSQLNGQRVIEAFLDWKP